MGKRRGEVNSIRSSKKYFSISSLVENFFFNSSKLVTFPNLFLSNNLDPYFLKYYLTWQLMSCFSDNNLATWRTDDATSEVAPACRATSKTASVSLSLRKAHWSSDKRILNCWTACRAHNCWLPLQNMVQPRLGGDIEDRICLKYTILDQKLVAWNIFCIPWVR